MVDRRLGRADGPQNSTGVETRPQFQTPDGERYEADNALDAARAKGVLRGDLRGQPSEEAPGASYVRRRRPAVEATPHAERLDETAHNPRASRRSERDARQYDDRQFSEDRALTDDERVAMLRQGFFQVALPDLPKRPDVHRMWLTTTNPRDPIAARLRMGYRLLRLEDLGPGWEQQKATSGDYAGCIVINEMIAAEIPMALFQRYMTELHHTMPAEQERGIRGQLDAYNEQLAEKGSRLVYEDQQENAFDQFGKHKRAAMFEG